MGQASASYGDGAEARAALISVLTTQQQNCWSSVSRTESEKGQLRASHLPLRILAGLLCALANELSFPPQWRLESYIFFFSLSLPMLWQ